jgi:hypothetical protein
MPRFVKVMPLDYKRVLEQIQEEEQAAQSDQIPSDYIITSDITDIGILEEIS